MDFSESDRSEDSERQIEIYVDRLAKYPDDVIERALKSWPSRDRAWPAWKRLEEVLLELAPPQREPVRPEHRKILPNHTKRQLLDQVMLAPIGQRALREGWARALYDHVVRNGDVNPSPATIQRLQFARSEFDSAVRDLEDPERPMHNRGGFLAIARAMEDLDAGLREQYLREVA